MPAETCRAICSMIFGGIFEKLPNLKVCFAHGGGSFPATIGRIEQVIHRIVFLRLVLTGIQNSSRSLSSRLQDKPKRLFRKVLG